MRKHLITCFCWGISCLRALFTTNLFFMPVHPRTPEVFWVHCLVLPLQKMINLVIGIQNRCPSASTPLSCYSCTCSCLSWDENYECCFRLLQEKGLRIAWQYKKYMGEQQPNFDSHRGKLVQVLFSFVFSSCQRWNLVQFIVDIIYMIYSFLCES